MNWIGAADGLGEECDLSDLALYGLTREKNLRMMIGNHVVQLDLAELVEQCQYCVSGILLLVAHVAKLPARKS